MSDELAGPAVGAMAGRLKAAGQELGRVRDEHAQAAATTTADAPVAEAHRRVVERWTEGLRVAAAALVELGVEIDECAHHPDARFVGMTSAEGTASLGRTAPPGGSAS